MMSYWGLLLRQLISPCHLDHVVNSITLDCGRLAFLKLLHFLLVGFNDHRREFTILLDECTVKHRDPRTLRGRNRHVELGNDQLIHGLRVQSEHPIGLLLFVICPSVTTRDRLHLAHVDLFDVRLLWLLLLHYIETTSAGMLRGLLLLLN